MSVVYSLAMLQDQFGMHVTDDWKDLVIERLQEVQLADEEAVMNA